MISELGIGVGYACNFKCVHCGVSHKKKLRLSDSEITRLVKTINTNKVPALLFVGGEPSLYIQDINRILSKVENLNKTQVRITTNGHFAKSKVAAKSLLSEFLRIDKVHLSYDKFHKKFLPNRNIKNLHEACRDSKIDFGVLMAIQSPMDLALLPQLRALGDFPIGIQKVLPTGAAKNSGVSLVPPIFDRRVLSRSCPNAGKIMYLCGEGFSLCCSSLVLNGNNPGFVHPTLSKHLNSRFYKMVCTKSFGEIMKIAHISESDLAPAHSESCNLCEHIFNTAGRRLLK